MEAEIRVGIPTDGKPCIEERDNHILLSNMLIGKGFHWQRKISALLPGRVELTEDRDFPIVNILPLEEYLECVVGSEMNPYAPEEFMKAHAIISRSWAAGKISGAHPADGRGKTESPERIVKWEDTCVHHGFHVCSDDHCQRYQGIQQLPASIRKALRATRGLVLKAPDGSLVDARFSKCCGGKTELFSTCWQPEERPCLESIDDPWCDLTGLAEKERNTVLNTILKSYDLANAGGFRWNEKITAEEIRNNLRNKFGKDIGLITDLHITARGVSGRAKEIKLTGTEGNIHLGKELMIRRLLAPTHLYSSWIDINKDPENPERYIIHGRGWGHGVGLCQIGAARMALAGHDFRSILSFYYPSSSISLL